MDIFVQSFDTSRIDHFKRVLDSMTKRDAAKSAVEIRIPYTRSGKDCEYIERIESPPTLLIVGAGHVAQALGQIASGLGFDLQVLDDRPDYVSAERFPAAKKRIV